MSFFRLWPGLKLSFEHNNVRKSLFWEHDSVGILVMSLFETDEKNKYGGTVGYGESYLEFFFVTSKYLDYMQYCMVMLEKCRHIVMEDLLFATCLQMDQIHVCLATWQDYSFAFTWNYFCLTFSSLSNLKQYVLHFIRYWASRYESFWGNWEFLFLAKIKDSNFVLHRSANPQNKRFPVQETCVELCGAADVSITLSFPTFLLEMWTVNTLHMNRNMKESCQFNP